MGFGELLAQQFGNGILTQPPLRAHPLTSQRSRLRACFDI